VHVTALEKKSNLSGKLMSRQENQFRISMDDLPEDVKLQNLEYSVLSNR
jgi:hypothetical protein